MFEIGARIFPLWNIRIEILLQQEAARLTEKIILNQKWRRIVNANGRNMTFIDNYPVLHYYKGSLTFTVSHSRG